MIVGRANDDKVYRAQRRAREKLTNMRAAGFRRKRPPRSAGRAVAENGDRSLSKTTNSSVTSLSIRLRKRTLDEGERLKQKAR